MTKKATWSGYRGNGKPSIPCVPNDRVPLMDVPVTDTSGTIAGRRTVRMPKDRTKQAAEVKRVQNEIDRVWQGKVQEATNQPYTITPYFSSYEHIHRLKHVKRIMKVASTKASEDNDLGMLLCYKKFGQSGHAPADIEGAASALRAMGEPDISETLTEEHVIAYSAICDMIARLEIDTTLSTSKVRRNIQRIAMMSFSGELSKESVVKIIAGRGVTNPDGIRELLREMKATPAAIESGVL